MPSSPCCWITFHSFYLDMGSTLNSVFEIHISLYLRAVAWVKKSEIFACGSCYIVKLFQKNCCLSSLVVLLLYLLIWYWKFSNFPILGIVMGQKHKIACFDWVLSLLDLNCVEIEVMSKNNLWNVMVWNISLCSRKKVVLLWFIWGKN